MHAWQLLARKEQIRALATAQSGLLLLKREVHEKPQMAGGARNRRKRASKPKSRTAAKDHSSSHHNGDASQLGEELTALSAIFQEDFTLISDKSFKEFSVNLRPHSVEFGGTEDYVPVELIVRCLPGYPCKPPRLQIKAKEGLSQEELHLLHSMLVEQASSISREGRVMIFNLVESAQEFLSERVGSKLSQDQQEQEKTTSVNSTEEGCVSNLMETTMQDSHEAEVQDVYGVVDLFGEFWGRDDSHWSGGIQTAASVLQANKSSMLQKKLLNVVDSVRRPEVLLDGPIIGHGEGQDSGIVHGKTMHISPRVKPLKLTVPVKKVQVESSETNAGTLTQRSLQFTSVSDVLQKVDKALTRKACEEPTSLENGSSCHTHHNSDQGSSLQLDQNVPTFKDGFSEWILKDFIMAHLLRLVCSPRGPLSHALPVLSSQLQELGVIPKWMIELLTHQPNLFDMTFNHLFHEYIGNASQIFETPTDARKFWNTDPELLDEDSMPSRGNSRYMNDFEELSLLGKGGFGHVVLCRNKLDGRRYAMKKIRLKDGSPSLNNKILREVATLSQLQHQHVVRYYQAWYETVEKLDSGLDEFEQSGDWIFSGILDKKDSSYQSLCPSIENAGERLTQRVYLYIQMEYCPRTLRQVLDTYTDIIDKDVAWHMFRQIVEGLAHIHGQGIIHRDLTPSNIFFDARNDIKIGDFGLAKFSNLEPPDREPFITAEMVGGSLDGTGQVGTYFYTAPEIDQGWPHIDEKVDMYSLGVVLFELWHPFNTAMQRHIILTDLKRKSTLPSNWATEFPQQAALVQRLMAANPSDRPSALQVLRNELPPRMEDEALNDILRTIQSAENSTIFDQIIAAIFDEERIKSKAQALNEELDCGETRDASFQDRVFEIAKGVFTQHGAHRFETCSMHLMNDPQLPNRRAVKLVSSTGSMLELHHEMRIPFAHWVAVNQKSSLKRYEISRVYRRGVGHSAPHEYFQGDFDVIGGSSVLMEAEVIKVAVDIVSKCFGWEACEICVNHSYILDSIWSWSGVKRQERQDVAKLLAIMSCSPPQSSDRKAHWVLIRRQLLQGLQLSELVVDRLQTVERRFSGSADEALARLRGALPSSVPTLTGIDELSTLLSYLRIWNVERNVHIDCLMSPSEEYYKGIFFQVHLPKGCLPRTSTEGMLLAVGGRYDQLIQSFWPNSLDSSAPGATGISIALEKLSYAAALDSGPEIVTEVLVCSKGGGGLLRERMELIAELWTGNIKAEFVCTPTPSLTEQYEYAHKHGIKWLIIITDTGLSPTGLVKVRHLELKVEEDVPRVNLVNFFLDPPVTTMSIRKRAASLREKN